MTSRIGGLFLMGFLILGASCSKAPKAEIKADAPEVTVQHLSEMVLSDDLILTGRLDAVVNVDIRSRVTGYIDKIYFKDGQFVKKGDLLYLIDPRPYQAKLDTAKGDVERLDGERKLTDIQVDRYKKLSDKGAASKQEYDMWIAKQAENLGSMASAKSQVVFNQLNLDFCKVIAPIDGQISRTQIQIGNLINADNTSLTNMVSIDPIYAYFNVDEPTLIRISRQMRSPTSDKRAIGQFNLDVGLVDDLKKEFPIKGKMDFVNNQLDKQTGTITVRGELSNPFNSVSIPHKMPLLKPGMFIRVRLPLSEPKPRQMVPEVAIGNNQDRKVIWIVNSEDKAQMIEVEVGQKAGELVPISPTDSAVKLGPETRVVVRGIQRCKDAKPVKPVMAEKGTKATSPPTEPASKVGKGKAPVANEKGSSGKP